MVFINRGEMASFWPLVVEKPGIIVMLQNKHFSAQHEMKRYLKGYRSMKKSHLSCPKGFPLPMQR